jgi:hypothetical protein
MEGGVSVKGGDKEGRKELEGDWMGRGGENSEYWTKEEFFVWD